VIFKRKNSNKPFSEKLINRVKRIPTAELSVWAESSLSDLGRCLSNFERTRDPMWIKEALNGAEAVNAVISELYDRHMV
jgi:hypothetical protein